ncbi:interferon-gamma-inducible GTPase 10-like [Emydura macquarii macquarii]|uniref:interferon-gamma-inducible GTPase 10-like n=1 Tax=Emydura macquarii macquarii TaxID=1129001 RepID=UPI00352B70C3
MGETGQTGYAGGGKEPGSGQEPYKNCRHSEVLAKGESASAPWDQEQGPGSRLTIPVSFPRKMADFTSIFDDLYLEDRITLLGMSVEQTKQIEASIKAGKFLEAASEVQKLTNLSDIEFSIAIAGESGSGKSSFINAIRGLGDEDKDAAETGVMEVTKEPVQYWHPVYPMVLFSDLPGIDTPDFQPNAYLKEVNFRHYDVFIIIASERFRANHIKVAQEIQRMGKKFYFVRSKVDLDLYNKKHKKSFKEERILEKIRNKCVSNLSGEGMSSPQVFLVSSREFKKYDSPKLQITLLKELYSHKIRATEAPRDRGLMEDSKPHWADLFSKWGRKLPGLSEEETEEIQTAVKAGNPSKAISVVKKSDELLRNTKVNIAITGDTGTGDKQQKKNTSDTKPMASGDRT